MQQVPLDPGGCVLAHEIIEQGGVSIDRSEVARLGWNQASHASCELDAKGRGIESRVTRAPNAAVRLALRGGVSCAHRFRHTAYAPPRNVESVAPCRGGSPCRKYVSPARRRNRPFAS